MADTLCQVVEKFLRDKSIRYLYDSEMVKRLFRGYTEKGIKGNKKPKPRSFAFLARKIIKNVINKMISDEEVQEAVGAAIKESVKAYTRDKDVAVNVYKDFVSFIRGKYQVNIPIVFPATSLSDFDRQMYIVKELHEKGRNIAYLEDKLWVSDRTIEEDIASLRNGISIMG